MLEGVAGLLSACDVRPAFDAVQSLAGGCWIPFSRVYIG
jgi:hypothetical protein